MMSTFSELEDNTIQLKKDLESFLYGLRINAEAHVIGQHMSFLFM
jgi:hypothetical protein